MKTLRSWLIFLLINLFNVHMIYASSTCVTPYFSCVIPQPTTIGNSCYCNTQYGSVYGVIGSSQANAQFQKKLPSFCCSPAGRFGPFPNLNTPVGGSCYADTLYGRVFGQACY